MAETLTKAQREAAAREAASAKLREKQAAAFVAAADARPESSMLTKPEPASSAQAEPIAAPEAETPVEAAQEPAVVLAPSVAAPKATKPATAPKPAPEPKKTPWADANPRIPVGFNTKFPEDMHAQLVWLKENLPNTSIQKLVHQYVRDGIAKDLAEHYKP